jgi:hypothetical protein
MTESAKTIVINLSILGELENGIKLNTREKHFTLDQITWYQGLQRLMRRDDRKVTYEKISFLIRNTQELVLNRPEEFTPFIGEIINIKPILEKAKTGLKSLKDTYEDDKTFSCEINVEMSSLVRLLTTLTENEDKLLADKLLVDKLSIETTRNVVPVKKRRNSEQTTHDPWSTTDNGWG